MTTPRHGKFFTDVGTLGSRAVDHVYATSPANKVRTIATPSDHDAVAAIY